MKRPMLVAGVTAALTSAFLLLFEEAAFVCAVSLAALVLIFYFIKPFKLRKYIIIPAAAVSVLAACAACAIFNSAVLAPSLGLTKETDADIYGKVTEIAGTYNPDIYAVTLKCDKVNGEKANVYITAEASAQALPGLYDYCKLTGACITASADKAGIAENRFLSASYEGFEVLWQADRDVFYYCAMFKRAVTERLNEYLGGDYYGIVRGMLFGETANISNETLQSFRSSGVSHLLAVSGLHTSLWCGLLISLLTLFRVPRRLRGIFCGVFLVLFCAVSSFTPSVIRASLMTSLVFAAPLFGRKADSLNSLGFAAAVLILCNPYTVFSVSFLLSFSATLGVILSKRTEEKIYEFNKKIPRLRLRRIVNYILTTVCVSAYAAVFTLPFSAYFFRTFSIIAPLTNIAAVKLAFYALVIAVIALAVSCIPLYAVQSAAIILFKICKSLLYAVMAITKAFGGFRYSVLPVQKSVFLPALAVCALLICLGFAFLRLRGKNTALKITGGLCAAVLAFSLIAPMFPAPCGTSLTVIPDGDNVFAVLKCGTEYAVFCSNEPVKPSLCRDYLPAAACEKLSFIYMNDISDASALEFFSTYFEPESVILTPFADSKYNNRSITSDILVKSGSYFTLNDKIRVKTVDTYRMRCVIMEVGNLCIILSLHADNDTEKILAQYGEADVLVMNGTDYKSAHKDLTCVLCCDASQALTKQAHNAAHNYKKFITTAEHGTFTINIPEV